MHAALSHLIHILLIATLMGAGLILLPSPAFAQFFVEEALDLLPEGILDSPVSLSFQPEYPRPNEEVRVSLNAHSSASQNATIYWLVDGEERVEFRNERQIVLRAGENGSAQTITARLVRNSTPIGTASRTLSVVVFDVVLEAQTVVPSFYKGRPLPSPGSTVRATALLHDNKNQTQYSYRWEIGNTVLNTGAVRGKQSVVFTVPELGRPILSVEILNAAGESVAKKNMYVDTFRPEVHFYPDNPLRSTARNAVVESFVLQADEATFRAEPYFADPSLFGPSWEHGWRLNGLSVAASAESPRHITLRRAGEGGGTARVSFEAVNLGALLQSVRDSFTVIFNE